MASCLLESIAVSFETARCSYARCSTSASMSGKPAGTMLAALLDHCAPRIAEVDIGADQIRFKILGHRSTKTGASDKGAGRNDIRGQLPGIFRTAAKIAVANADAVKHGLREAHYLLTRQAVYPGAQVR